MTNDIPCISAVMIYETFYVLKNKYLRLTFFHNTGKFPEKCSASVLKSLTLTDHRKSLTGCASYKNINLAKILSGIQGMNIRMPFVLRNIIIGEIRFFTFFINITGKHYFKIKT